MSVKDNDPEEAKGIQIFKADGTFLPSEAQEHEEWLSAFKGSNPENIEVYQGIIANGSEYKKTQ